jgi:beta-alanine degradation protein BauB
MFIRQRLLFILFVFSTITYAATEELEQAPVQQASPSVVSSTPPVPNLPPNNLLPVVPQHKATPVPKAVTPAKSVPVTNNQTQVPVSAATESASSATIQQAVPAPTVTPTKAPESTASPVPAKADSVPTPTASSQAVHEADQIDLPDIYMPKSAIKTEHSTRRIPLFTNQKVKVWEAVVMPSLNQQLKMHRHNNDRVLIALTDGVLKIVNNKGQSRLLKLTKNQAYYLMRDLPGELHTDENIGDMPFRAIVVELKCEDC